MSLYLENEDDEIDHDHTDEIVCPCCGYEHQDSWEFQDNGEQKCYGCKKVFTWDRQVKVTYCTTKKNDK